MNTLEIVETAGKLKLLLPECDEAQQLMFKRMYSHKNLELSILEVVDNMKPENLKMALRQVEATIEKNLAKLLKNKSPGYAVGDVCNRNGCVGIITEHDTDGGCSCHINPPCSYCETSREYCPVCNWAGREEQIEANKDTRTPEQISTQNDYWTEERRKQDEWNKNFEAMYRGEKPVDRVIIISETHSNSSMIRRGVFPKGTTQEQLLKEHRIRGTFGGRWESFTNHSFKYIAYTD